MNVKSLCLNGTIRLQYSVIKLMHEFDELRDSCKSNKSRPRKAHQHRFPKANEILQSLNHQKKSIYPFHMKSNTHKMMSEDQQPYDTESSKSMQKFHPLLPTIPMHFNKKYLIYDKFNSSCQDDQLFNENIFSLQKLKSLKNYDYITQLHPTTPLSCPNDPLTFDSCFQAGNLSMVSKICQIYYLLLHHDVNTSGYTNWFYFSIKNKTKGLRRFAILNYGKAGNAHNMGVKICVYEKGTGWRRDGKNIVCVPNSSIFQSGKYLKCNTLYFEYVFQEENCQVFFAYNIPYTYSDLCGFLNSIQKRNLPSFHRKLAGVSLAGNRIQEITITNFDKLKSGNTVPVIILMARAHPGQTVSSWIMHEFINFIISDDEEACDLRNSFIFKIFPMINPDGVIHGNYRCSLSGRDLNRRWGEPNKQIFPQIYFVKKIITDVGKKKTIKMILDLHGHTQKKNIFAYGCNDRREPQRCRLFPYIISKLTPFFSFKFCNYFMDRQKLGTARISLYTQLKIPYIYTIETSQFGTVEGHLSLKVFREISHSIAKSFAIIFKAKNVLEGNQQFLSDVDRYYDQLKNDLNLMKIGAEQDAGSDSQPSVDNIKLEHLTQLVLKKSLRTSAPSSAQEQPQRQTPSLKKLEPQISLRPRTSSLRKNQKSQKQPRKSSFLETRFSSFRSHVELAGQNKMDVTSYLPRPSQREIFSSKRKTEKMNFINLSFSLTEQSPHKSHKKRAPNMSHTHEQLLLKLGAIGGRRSIYRKLA